MKQRSFLELEIALLRAVNFGAGQIGRQQVGSKLDAMEIGFDAFAEDVDGAGLGESRRAFDQNMAVGQ